MAYGHAVDDAALALRRMILLGELKPGDHLRQDDLAHRLGVTRVPIREAFKLLVAEGILVHRRNHGHFVEHLSTEEVRQLYWIRDALENEVVRSARWPAADTLDALRELNDQMLASARRGEIEQLLTTNRTLHFVLFDLSPSRVITSEISRLWDRVVRYHALYLYTPEAALRVVEEHTAIIDSVQARDRPLYRRLMREHRHGGESAVVDVLGTP